jgi:hypothetical protein
MNTECEEKMETARKNWNARQMKLRTLLSDPLSYPRAIDLFIQQHAEVHSRRMSSIETLSFEDEVLVDMTDAQIRELPDRMDHSIAWIIWHLARIEDVAMNILVAGNSQVFERDDWKEKLNISFVHTGNAMSRSEVIELSNGIDIYELRNYRIAVGRKTEEIVNRLSPEEVGRRVYPSRLDLIMQEKAVLVGAKGLLDYWGKRTIAGLLLMPPTRHCFVHLNEATRIKNKLT